VTLFVGGLLRCRCRRLGIGELRLLEAVRLRAEDMTFSHRSLLSLVLLAAVAVAGSMMFVFEFEFVFFRNKLTDDDDDGIADS